MKPPALSLRLMQAQPDGRLVELARQGHEPAFEALVRRYRKELLSYCRRLQSQSGSAEDALQQTFLHAWRALNNGAEVRDAKAWLYRIAHNVSLNTLRVPVAVPHEVLDTSGEQDLTQLVEQRSQARAALAGMASLPALQRQVFISTTLEGASHEEVATTLGLSYGAVRGLVYRARQIVRGAAAAITPGPVANWAIRRAETGSGGAPALVETIAGGGGAGVAAVIAKGGAVLTLAVAGAGGAILSPPPGHDRHVRAHIARLSGLNRTASRPGPSVRATGAMAKVGHNISSNWSAELAGSAPSGRASLRISGSSPTGERHGASSGTTTAGENRVSLSRTQGGLSSASSGKSDRGPASGATIATPGSGSGDGASSGSSGSSQGGSGPGRTSTLTASGSDGGTSGGPAPSSVGQLTTVQTTSDGRTARTTSERGATPEGSSSSASDGRSSSGSSGSGKTVTTSSSL